MKLILCVSFCLFLPFGQSAKASGVSWSSLTLSDFRDSYGNSLDDTFRVQLGFFEDTLAGDFVPDGSNVADWVTQWKVFDEASINLDGEGSDYFTSEAWVGSDGLSYINPGTSPILNPDASNTLGLNYAGQTAYIWLYNEKTPTPSPTTEWFLARMEDWILPAGSAACCDTTPNLQWNISQLDGANVTPIWGAQSGEIGNGHYTDPTPGVYDLQTFTFIPEPSSLLLAVLGSFLLLRRRRDHVISCLLFASFGLLAMPVQAATTDGALRMEVITAYNLVVDSNIETPAGKSPSAAHMGVKIFNDGTVPLTNVVVNIGKLTTPATSTGTPGVFEERTVDVSGQYAGTFSLQAPGGVADCTRIIPSIEPGEYVVQYFFVSYPLLDSLNRSVTGAASVPEDDLWLNYDTWAYASDGVTTRRVDKTNKVTMRNEISAMANKIWPNTDSKVPDEYLNAIEATIGWRPEAGNTRVPGAVVMEGIWYDLGNIGAGFDNDGDGLPDRNAWMQPVGDPDKFSPLAARLVKCYGLLVIKLNDGTEQLIPFEDQLYFEKIAANNTGAVGLVYYEFLPLNLSLPALLSPYQEVASGYDNEKFNSDYGASVGSVSGTPPLVAFDKDGPVSIAGGATATYTLSATNNELSGSSKVFGWPELSLPLVFQDTIPTSLVYVAGSATVANTAPSGQTYVVYWSTDSGATWVDTEPSPSTVTTIRWIMSGSLAAGQSAAVSFQATVPTNYAGAAVDNTACLKTGTEIDFACDTTTSKLTGNNSLGDFIWRDLDRDGVQDGGLETGISGIGVSLYIDTDGDGVLDSGEPLYATTTTDVNGAYLFSDLPDRKYIAVVNATDAIPSGFTLKAGVDDFFAVDLDFDKLLTDPVNHLTADWPFIKALEVTKTVTPTTYFGGDLITYDIHLDNHMNTLQLPVASVQTVYATTTAFDKTNAAGFATQAQAAGAPNTIFTFIDWNANSDRLVTTGITPTYSENGTVTKVELIIRGYMSSPLSNDGLSIEIGHAGRAIAAFATRTTAEMNALVGVSQDLVIDITGAGTWGIGSNQVQTLSAALNTTKTGGGDTGDYNVDSIGFRVTTDNTPFEGSSGPNTISQWPIVDTYDSDKLEFVSASVTPDNTTPLGTLEWYNLGPVNAGARKSITVTFRAKTPTDTSIPLDGKRDPMTATNTITTEGCSGGHIPLFQTGLPAGNDDSSVDVTINPAGRIGDFVYWDVNANSIYDSGDAPLRRVIVQLYQDLGAGFVYTGRSQYTDVTGYYDFAGLADGTYQVHVTTDTASDLFSLPWTTFTSYQKGTAGTNQTVYVQGDSVVINNADFVTTNDTNFLQDFGFDSNAASLISGNLFRDWNGDGIKDPGDEPLVGYTVTLTGGATTTTDSNGFYIFSNITTAGDYTVTVTAPPVDHNQTLDPDLAPGNTGGDDATTVTVVLGNFYMGRNFAYQPSGTLTIGDTLYYDWNGNGTQDAGEDGIPNVSIHLHEDANGDGIINATDGLVDSIVTDANGFYQFTGLAAGNYIVTVDEGDPDFPTSHIQTQDYDGLADDKAQVNLVTSLDTVDFGYLPTGTASIGNLVWLDADNDGIKDASESGINGVTVQLYHASQTPGVDTPASTTTTSGGGFYLFENLSSDGYYVYIPASNFDPGQPLDLYHWSSVTTSTADNQVDNDDNGIQTTHGDPVTSPLITLSAAESDQTVDFGFTGSGAIGDFVFYDSNGNGSQDFSEGGISGVTVELYLDANADGVADSPTPVRTTVTSDGTDGNAVGYYRFGHLITGTYLVQVDVTTLPAGVIYTSDPDFDGVPAHPIDNPGDNADSLVIVTSESNYSGADFGYQPPGAIGDFVWLDLNQDGVQDSGEPGLAGVSVEITDGVTTYTVTTDFDGYWSQILADGNWTVSIPASNFTSGNPLENLAATYDADAGTLDTVDITITGGTVDLPVGNLGIDFGYKLNGNYGLSGTIAIHDTGLPGTADDVDDFYDDGVDMDAGPLDEVELSGIYVYLYTNAGDFLGTTVTDANGDYAFTGLASGDYKVIIGTTDAPLDNSTLTTTTGNNLSGSTVTSTATSVTQVVTIATSTVVNVDFTFNSTVDYDFGDLPSSYSSTTLAQDGARHIIPGGGSTLYLGTAPDADTNGLPSSLANGDDSFGSDDEDGVIPVSISTWADGVGGGSIEVSVTGTGWLVGWIDWNHDNDFLDAGEFIVSQAVSTGTSTISFDIPAGTIGATSESWLSRFRVFTSEPAFPLFSYEGEATNGEVEDYLIEKPVAGSIGDLVWRDLNGDGVKDSSEEGIGGLTVQAFDGITTLTQTTGTGSNDVDGDGVIDPAGYYMFRGLAAATYTITVTTPPAGYLPSYDENGTVSPHVTSVILAASEQHLTADFGYAPQTADISGQVRYDTNGDGNPADPDAGALAVKIQLWTDPNGDGNPSDGVQVGETYTNASGNYLFADVPTGNYVVVEINPSGTTSTYDVAGTLNDDRIPVVMVGVDITGRDFLDTQPSLYSIAGTVYEDAVADNNTIDGLDAVLGGVTVKLFFDRDGNGLVSAGDTELVSTTTDSNGDYSFTGLVAGSYVVQKTNPSGGSITNDWDAQGSLTDSQIAVALSSDVMDRDYLIDGYLGAITGSVTADTDNNGSGDLALEGVVLTLLNSDGSVYDSDTNTGGIQPLTTTTASDGSYSFTNLMPGTYGVSESQPGAYTSLSDKDGGNLDEIRPIIVTHEAPNTGNDFVEMSSCPDTWPDWKQLHPSETATGDPDGDDYANFTEFAFAMPYDSGTGSEWLDHTAWIVQESAIAPGTVEGVFVRPTGAYLNVVYTLQYAASIGDPTVWTTIPIPPASITITPNGDCTETVTIHHLASVTGLTDNGVVRLKAELDDDGGNDEVDLTTYTETEGWTITDCAVCCQSYNNPYARESVFTGTIGAVSGQQISFTGEQLLGNILEVGASYYIEVGTGTHEGHRYDVTLSGADSLTLASDNDLYAAAAPFNTTTTAPPETLVGAKIALRRHWKLAEMFPPLDHVATGDQATADQIQIFVEGAWKIYWLYDQNDVDPDTAIWVDAADVGMADQGAVIIPPGQGMLFNNRGAATTQLSCGEIRLNDFIRPLPIGRSFVGGGFPLDQSAASARGRQMTKGVGFFGSRDFTTADSFFLWNADTILNGRSYSTYFLHDATPKDPPLIRWVVVGDNVIQSRDSEVHFKSDRAVFIRTKNGLSAYTIPSPWAP